MSKHFVLFAAAVALFAVASPARAATPLHETASGVIVGGGPSGLSVFGSVSGYPVTGPMSAEYSISSGSPGEGDCLGTSFPTTATVTLGAGADSLVKTETGTFCASSFGVATFTGTYVIDGADSTGIYRGASGSGTTTASFLPFGPFGSEEDGTITAGRGKTLPPPPRTPKPPPPPKTPKNPTAPAHRA